MGYSGIKSSFFLLFLFAALSLPLGAQDWATKIRLTDRAVLSMVTIYPGEALYSMFGHTAIRVRDPDNNIDLLYNYGQSSVPFDASFVPRFVGGDLPFILGVSDTVRSFEYYSKTEDRSIYEQVFSLTRAQKQEIFDFLAENARKENRTYIYDFFFDNCTTRVRDMFDQLFGRDLHYEPEIFDKTDSYRREIAPYLEGFPYVKFGIDLVLGLPTDGIPGRDRQLYLPLQLMEAVETATLRGVNSSTGKSFGSEETKMVASSGFVYRQKRSGPEGTPITPGIFLWVLFGLTLVVSFSPIFSVRLRRWFSLCVFIAAGLVGISSVILWGFSGYVMTHWNLNLLWAWPTHLIVAPFFPTNQAKKKTPSVDIHGGRSPFNLYLTVTMVVAVSVVLGSPLLPQQLPAAALPFALSLALCGFRNVRHLD